MHVQIHCIAEIETFFVVVTFSLSVFQIVIRFHPGQLHVKTLVNSFSAVIWQFLE